MALTRKLTKSLTRPLTRKLTGAELEQLFLEKFKLTVSDTERLTNNFFSNDSGWNVSEASTTGVSGGKMVLNNASNAQAFYFDNATEEGKSYEVKFIISDYSSGGIRIRFPEDADRVYNANGNYTAIITANTSSNVTRLTFTIVGTTTLKVDNVFVKEISQKPPIAAFSLRKLGNVSPYACRIRRSSDHTEAQVMFDSSDRVSESSVVRNTSQNLLSFSEQLNNSAWSNNQGGTATLSAITDPFGGNNSYEVSGGSQTYGGIYDTITGLLTTGKNYVYSIYLKKGTSTKSKISYYDSTSPATNLRLTIDWASDGEGTINTGETSTADLIATSFEEIGTDGWYRASIAFTAVDTNDVQSLTIEPDRTGNGNTVLAFGAMLEEATNYSLSKGTVLLSDTFSDNSTGWNFQVGDASITNGLINFNVVNGGYIKVQKSLTYNQNRYYTLTATVNGTVGKKMRFRDDAGDDGGLTDGNPTGAVDGRITLTGSPQEVSLTWMPTADSTEIVIERDTGTGDYNFTVDNLVIKETTPIFQDDFNDNSNNWSFTPSNADNLIANGVINQTVVTDYTKAAITSFSLWEEGCKYRLTADVNGTAGKRIRFRDDTSNEGGLTTVNGAVTFTGGPQKVVLDFIANANSDELAIERTDSNHSWTIDNLKIEKFDVSPSEYISTPVISNDGLTFTESTLDAFVGSGDAHVVTFYNQTGGEDIIQETQTKQPKLYSSGQLVKANASPALQFDGTDDVMKFSPDGFANNLNLNSLSSFLVFKADYIAGFDYVFNLGTSTNDKDWFLPFINGGNFVVRYGTNSNSGTTGNTNVNLISGVAGLQSGKFKAFLNGTQTDIRDVENNSSDTGIASVGGLEGTSNQFEGKILEIIVFDTEQHTTREAIEADIANFHNITLS